MLWVKRFGGVGDQTAELLLRASDGSLVLLASYSGRLELGDQVLTCSTGSADADLALVHLTPDGVPTSAHQMQHSQFSIRDGALDSRDHLILIGTGYTAARFS
jgi:hypothetical protein